MRNHETKEIQVVLTKSITTCVILNETQAMVFFAFFGFQMPGTSPNPQLTLQQSSEAVDYMANEVVPEAIYDQGLYYPANYYGYFCTGEIFNLYLYRL